MHIYIKDTAHIIAVLKRLINARNILIINMNHVGIARSLRAVLLGPSRLTTYMRTEMPVACMHPVLI